MKVWALWYGGGSYACPCFPRDLEEFASIKDAKRAMERRSDNLDGQTPCVEGSEMQLFFSLPEDHSDPYPDRVLTFGPRGGIHVERC